MKTFLIVNTDDLSIVYHYEAESIQKVGGIWNREPHIQVEVPEEYPWETVVIQQDAYGVYFCAQDDDLLDAYSQALEDAKWTALREVRNNLLNDEVDREKQYMDWGDVYGNTYTSDKKLEWAMYRQQLLDVPQNISDINEVDLETFEWPTKPADGYGS